MKISIKAMGGIENEIGFQQREVNIESGTNVLELLDSMGAAADLMVSLNDVMLPKDDYARTSLSDGDELLLLPPMKAG